jgi:hypothetical protein
LRLCLWTVATSGPLVHPPDDIWVGRATVEWYRWENWRNRRKTYPSATLSTNPTWTDPGAKVGLHGEGLATNCLSNGDLLYMCCVHKQVTYFKCADRQVFPSVNAPFMETRVQWFICLKSTASKWCYAMNMLNILNQNLNYYNFI